MAVFTIDSHDDVNVSQQYLIEEAHHLHKRRGVALLASDALNFRLDSLEERVQILQHARHLVGQVLGERPHPLAGVRHKHLLDWT